MVYATVRPTGDPVPIRHEIVGHFNPHCATCGRTPMQIQANPAARCDRMTLPFEHDSDDLFRRPTRGPA